MEPPDRRDPRDDPYGRYSARSGGRPPQPQREPRREPRYDTRGAPYDPTAPLPPLSTPPAASPSHGAASPRPTWPNERATRKAPPRRRFSLSWALVIILALVVIGIASYGVYTTSQARRPYAAAQAFCADLRARQYTAAYGMLASSYRKTITQQNFTLTYQLHDQLDGPISVCNTPAPSSVFYTYTVPTTINIPTQITRKQTLQGTLSLVEEGKSWRVSQVGASLQGTDVGPLLAQNTFCNELIAGNYAAAYAQLAPGEQTNGAESDFATTFAHAFGGGAGGGMTLTRCQPDLSSYTVANGDAQVKVTFVAQASGQAVDFPTQFTFIQTRGVWEIASVNLRVVPIS